MPAVLMVLVLAPSAVHAATPLAAPSSRTVLAIHWGPEDFPPTPIVSTAIREALEAGADLPVFRTPGVWETYRVYIAITIGVVLAQLLLIIGLLTERTRRRRAEKALEERRATLRTSYERIRLLAGGLINAQESTRAKIARDLHDDVCQDLVGVSLGISSLKGNSGDVQDPTVQQTLTRLQDWALAIVDGVRRLSHELHPASLQLLGLPSALRAHCVEVERRHDVQVFFDCEGELKDIHPDVALCLFRIAQEALRNGAVHGQAHRFTVALTRTEHHVELAVTDDGYGFDLEAVRHERRGLGLVSMEERANLVGGHVQFVTRPGEGTAVHAFVPAGRRPESVNVSVTIPVIGGEEVREEAEAR